VKGWVTDEEEVVIVIYSYLPTGRFLDFAGLTEIKELAVAKGIIAIDPDIAKDFEPSEFTMQFNPAEFEISRDITYAVRKAPGLDMPTKHYIGGNLREMPIRLLVEDDVDGPPAGFDDLFGVMQWFDLLTKPVEKTGYPPTMQLSMGSIAMEGELTKLTIRVLRAYANLAPRFVELNLNLLENA